MYDKHMQTPTENKQKDKKLKQKKTNGKRRAHSKLMQFMQP
jgi:hypothetical protein